MREILFRGQRDDNNGYDGEWIYGFGTNGTAIIHLDLWAGFLAVKVAPDTIGQYIQKKDKNNTQIFDGDIVRTKYGRLCRVVWFEPKACWDLAPIDAPENIDLKAPDEWDMWHSCNLEVCGSIHTTPELMGERERES